MNTYRSYIPEYSRLLLPLALLWNLLFYYGSEAIAENLRHYDMTMAIDSLIPVIPPTVIVYFLSFFFWAVNYVLAARRAESFARKFFFADFVVKAVSFFFFVIVPTTCVRPQPAGTDFFSGILRILYFLDSPTNLFPSLHCSISLLAAFAVTGDEKVSPAYRLLSWFVAMLICVSTLTTKQHVFIDFIGGISLASLALLFAELDYFSSKYTNAVYKVQKVIKL